MSNNESFIDEVTEEVRRDKLFAVMRRWGWVGIAVVLLIVGGAAANEWRKAEAQAAAQAFGDAILDARDLDDPAARLAALAAIPATGSHAKVRDLLISADPAIARADMLAALDTVAADTTLLPVWRDLAILRRVLLAGADQPLADRRAALEPLAAAGRPYRTLASEHLALLMVEAGDPAAAIAALTTLMQDQEATPGLRRRAAQVIVALGGTPDAG